MTTIQDPVQGIDSVETLSLWIRQSFEYYKEAMRQLDEKKDRSQPPHQSPSSHDET